MPFPYIQLRIPHQVCFTLLAINVVTPKKRTPFLIRRSHNWYCACETVSLITASARLIALGNECYVTDMRRCRYSSPNLYVTPPRSISPSQTLRALIWEVLLDRPKSQLWTFKADLSFLGGTHIWLPLISKQGGATRRRVDIEWRTSVYFKMTDSSKWQQ